MTAQPWREIALRHIATEWCDGPFGSGLTSAHYREAGARVIRLQNIRANGFDKEDTAFVSQEYFQSELSRHAVVGGDLLIAGLGDDNNLVGRACLAPPDLGDALVKADCFRFRLDRVKAEPRFVMYALSATAERDGGVLSTGSTRQRVNLSAMAGRKLRLPVALSEQERIANFLDERTSQIDALLAEKERLVEVLGQHAQAVVDAVTVAEGKAQAKLGYFVDLLPGYAFPSEEFSRDPADVPLLRGVNVTPSGVRWDDAVYWRREYDEALARFVLKTGDVVLGMDRPWISTGARVTLIDDAAAGSLLLQRVCRLRGGPKIQQRFIYYALASDAFRQSVEVEMTGVSVPHLSPEQILRFKVPVLSPDEQAERCGRADRALSEISKLQEHTDNMLARLREYRSSLITTAVTGQLDINNFKAH